ncbi:MAG: hypothetical protein R6V45_08160 [Oceanipulchritudo sp.]
MKQTRMSATVIGVAWLASLGAVFILGMLSAFAFHLAPGTGAEGRQDLTLDQRDLVLTIERYAGTPVDIAALFGSSAENAVPEQLEQTLRAVLRENDPTVRALACLRLVKGLPPRLLTGSVRLLREIPSGPARDQVLGLFLEGWAENDGRSAIAFATSVPSPQERQAAIASALRGWSKDQPPDAWNWVIEREGTSRQAERWLEVILADLGMGNRQTALLLLEKLPSEAFQARMARVVMEQILQAEPPREALEWLSEFPPEAEDAAAQYLARVWAQTEPSAAADWFEEAFPGRREGLAEILREWVYLNPEAAADWTWNELPDSEREELLPFIAEEWIANEGPAPLAEWLNSLGADPLLDGAIEALALASTSMDPATAMVWAQSVIDPDVRSMLEIYIGREWIRMSPEEAEESLPLVLESESARAALLEEDTYEEIDEEIDDTRMDPKRAPLDGPAPPDQ